MEILSSPSSPTSIRLSKFQSRIPAPSSSKIKGRNKVSNVTDSKTPTTVTSISTPQCVADSSTKFLSKLPTPKSHIRTAQTPKTRSMNVKSDAKETTTRSEPLSPQLCPRVLYTAKENRILSRDANRTNVKPQNNQGGDVIQKTSSVASTASITTSATLSMGSDDETLDGSSLCATPVNVAAMYRKKQMGASNAGEVVEFRPEVSSRQQPAQATNRRMDGMQSKVVYSDDDEFATERAVLVKSTKVKKIKNPHQVENIIPAMEEVPQLRQRLNNQAETEEDTVETDVRFLSDVLLQTWQLKEMGRQVDGDVIDEDKSTTTYDSMSRIGSFPRVEVVEDPRSFEVSEGEEHVHSPAVKQVCKNLHHVGNVDPAAVDIFRHGKRLKKREDVVKTHVLSLSEMLQESRQAIKMGYINKDVGTNDHGPTNQVQSFAPVEVREDTKIRQVTEVVELVKSPEADKLRIHPYPIRKRYPAAVENLQQGQRLTKQEDAVETDVHSLSDVANNMGYEMNTDVVIENNSIMESIKRNELTNHIVSFAQKKVREDTSCCQATEKTEDEKPLEVEQILATSNHDGNIDPAASELFQHGQRLEKQAIEQEDDVEIDYQSLSDVLLKLCSKMEYDINGDVVIKDNDVMESTTESTSTNPLESFGPIEVCEATSYCQESIQTKGAMVPSGSSTEDRQKTKIEKLYDAGGPVDSKKNISQLNRSHKSGQAKCTGNEIIGEASSKSWVVQQSRKGKDFAEPQRTQEEEINFDLCWNRRKHQAAKQVLCLVASGCLVAPQTHDTMSREDRLERTLPKNEPLLMASKQNKASIRELQGSTPRMTGRRASVERSLFEHLFFRIIWSFFVWIPIQIVKVTIKAILLAILLFALCIVIATVIAAKQRSYILNLEAHMGEIL